MKKWALTLVFLLLVNVIGVFGVSAAELTAPTVYDGADDVTYAIVTVEKVDGLAGKETTDKVYKVTGKGSSSTGVTPCATNLSDGIAQTIEFSFMIPTDSTGLIFASTARSYSGTAYANDGAVTLTISAGSSLGASEAIQKNKWYTIAIQHPCDGTKAATVYLNGVSVGSVNLSKATYNIARNNKIGAAATGEVVYLDNITGYQDTSIVTDYTGTKPAKAFSAADSAASYVTEVSTGWKFDNDAMKVYAPLGTKLSDLDDAITTTDEAEGTDAIRVYNSDLSQQITDSNAEIIGNTLVIAANEMSYSYYSIVENDLDEVFGRGKNASDIIFTNSALMTAESVQGNYGKAASDDVYAVTKTDSGTSGIHFAKMFKDGTTLGSTWHHLEYSFALSEGAVLSNVIQYIVPETVNANKYTHTMVIIDKDRIRSSTESNASVINVEINEEQWYTLGIDIPSDEDENGQCKIYLNGKYVGAFGTPYAKGFRQPYTYTNLNKTVYMDNISVKENYTYAPLADTPSVISADGAIAANGKLSYVGDVPATFTTSESTVTRSYSAGDVNYIVAAEKDADGFERVLTYYAIDSAASDYISGGFNDTDGNYKAVAYGKDDKAKLIIAKYANGGLDSVQSIDFADGKAEYSTKEKVRAFVWDSYTGLVPLTNEVSFNAVR